jgi:hypothetical protein
MTLQEIMKAKGVDNDLIQAIMDDMKANKVYTASEENLDIRHSKLKTQHESVSKQLEEANALIETMKKETKGQEGLQTKITDYENRIHQLEAELQTAKLEAEIKVGLLAEKVVDVDYVTFKLKEKGELALDENGKIKGWEDKVAALKTQLPNQFETSSKKEYVEKKLPDHQQEGGGMTKGDFLRKSYAERAAFAAENPDAYKSIINH